MANSRVLGDYSKMCINKQGKPATHNSKNIVYGFYLFVLLEDKFQQALIYCESIYILSDRCYLVYNVLFGITSRSEMQEIYMCKKPSHY